MTAGQPLKDKVALVTGASRGIGRAIAVEFAKAGADIVLAARSTGAAPSRVPGTLDETAAAVEAAGRRAITIRTDVSDDQQVEALAEQTLKEFGRLDVLVNNAAYIYPSPFYETSIRRFDRVFNVNLRGPAMIMQAFLPSMMERKEGRVLNIISGPAEGVIKRLKVNLEEVLGGKSGSGTGPASNSTLLCSYLVSKNALDMLTRVVAIEMAPFGIQVNALGPGTVASEGAMYVNPDADYSGWRKPQESARGALWLVSQPIVFTGKSLEIDEVEAMMKGNLT